MVSGMEKIIKIIKSALLKVSENNNCRGYKGISNLSLSRRTFGEVVLS